MNTIFTLIGSYDSVLVLIYELQMGHRLSVVKRTRNYNSKSITDNSAIRSEVETLLSGGFNINDLNVAIDVLKNANFFLIWLIISFMMKRLPEYLFDLY